MIRIVVLALVVVGFGCGDDSDSPSYTDLSIQESPTLPKGAIRKLTVLARSTATGNDEDVTGLVSWQSSNSAIASVRADGQVTAVSVGLTTIKATLDDLEAITTVTVSDAELMSLTIPSLAPVPAGLDRTVTVTGTYTDGSTAEVSSIVTWSSSNDAVATISSTGVAHGVATGDVTITATTGTFSAMATLHVADAVLVSIEVTPDGQTILQGETLQLTATGTYSDASTADITDEVTWTSDDADVTVSAAGLASASADAVATITATDAATSVTDTTMLTSLAAARIQLTFAGGSMGDVRVEDVTGAATLATCSASCEVIAPIGHTLSLVAITPATFGGFAGGCTTTSGTCTLTAAAGGSTVTATFALDPGHAWQRLLYPDETVYAADFDSAGHLAIGTSNHVAKLDTDGTTIWELTMPARQLRVGPSDTIYVVSGTNLVKLDASGTTLWTRALGVVAPQPDTLQFVDRLDVGADGVAAVSGANHVATWAADGTPGWSASIPTAGIHLYGVAIDTSGNVWTAVDDQSSGERIWVQGFTSAGVAIATQLTPNNQYHGMIVADSAGHITIASSGHSKVRLDRRSASNVSDFSIGFDVADADYAENGVAVASTNLFWVHDNAETCCAAGFVARVVSPAGSVTATITRTATGDIGVRAYTVAGDATGRRAIAGEFWGPNFSHTGWVQAYTP